MDLFKYDKKTQVTRVPPPTVWCEKCDKPMYPPLYSNGMCCPMWETPVGMLDYVCAVCGKTVEIQHRHQLHGS